MCQPLKLLLVLSCVSLVFGDIDGQTFTHVLDNVAREALGLQDIQEYLDTSVQFDSPTSSDGSDLLQAITGSMQRSMLFLEVAVKELRDSVEGVLNAEKTFTRGDTGKTQYEPCRDVTGLVQNPGFPNLTVNMDKMCVLGPGIDDTETTYPEHQTILEVVKSNAVSIPELKWQYAAFEENYVITYPATRINWPNFNPRFRSWYKETASPLLKDIVLVFDKSRSMQQHLLRDGKLLDVLKTVINTLGPKDRIGIVGFDGEALNPDGCYSNRLALCIPINIQSMEDFVNGLPLSTTGSSGQSNYTKAFTVAFDYFINSPTDDQRDKVILFMSDGRPTDTEDEILETIRRQNAKLNNQVVIHTFGIGLVDDTDSGPRLLMTNIAEQTRADGSAGKVAAGEYYPASDAEQLRQIMTSVYNRPVTSRQSQAVFSGPYHDGFGFGIVYSACLPIHKNGNTFVGVTCIDILMRDLVQELRTNNNMETAYTFMLDTLGRYVYHPLLPLSTDKEDQPVYADFSTLERAPSAHEVKDGMMRRESGSRTVTTNYVTPRGTTQRQGADYVIKSLKYEWAPIPDTEFSVCVVLDVSELVTDFSDTDLYPDRVLFHRTDIQTDPPKSCNNFNRVGYKDNATVFLTVDAFRSPGRYYNLHKFDSSSVSNIEKYLETGGSNSLQIKPEVRKTVAVFYDKVQEIWSRKQNADVSDNIEPRVYTRWRHLGVKDGVFISAPGGRIPHYYDHTTSDWYRKAQHDSGDYVLVGPYTDMENEFSTVTLAKTLTTPSSDVLGVAGVEISLEYLYRQLTESYTKCQVDQYGCLVMDDNGRVILHSDYLDGNRRDAMATNIVTVEPDVARALMSKNVMIKQECLNIHNPPRYQSFFRVEIPLIQNGGLRVDGEFFNMYMIPESNLFLIVKDKQHTDLRSCFCLPSRECYSGSSDCPCPCHSEAEYDYCENQLPSNIDVPLPCYPEAPSYPIEDLLAAERDSVSRLQPCYQDNCATRTDSLVCESSLTCSWCNNKCKPTAQCKVQDPSVSTPPSVNKPGSQEGGDTSGGAPVGAIVGGVVGGVVVMVIVILLVVLYKRRAAGKPENKRPGTEPRPTDDYRYGFPRQTPVGGGTDEQPYSEIYDVPRDSPPDGAIVGFINPGLDSRPLPATPGVILQQNLSGINTHPNTTQPHLPHPSPEMFQLVRGTSTYRQPPTQNWAGEPQQANHPIGVTAQNSVPRQNSIQQQIAVQNQQHQPPQNSQFQPTLMTQTQHQEFHRPPAHLPPPTHQGHMPPSYEYDLPRQDDYLTPGPTVMLGGQNATQLGTQNAAQIGGQNPTHWSGTDLSEGGNVTELGSNVIHQGSQGNHPLPPQRRESVYANTQGGMGEDIQQPSVNSHRPTQFGRTESVYANTQSVDDSHLGGESHLGGINEEMGGSDDVYVNAQQPVSGPVEV